ncbi:lipopolysaccharide kinase InaA family protein [Ulvibacter antarcticus]|uniref:Lipopolysaccharide kinase (Kdo/WaaP) family protein n=1 Tax=Ulvibacter antarcticus TaxID=442714 RepID=A0A3L9YHA3_9FLAO|nr:lipopolysaccharide kinase InaA family protein [Ulvibacter antarcticus]RMA58569.1 lipopolysaccharide kinase (Kdo/WaaP) family protein [Ulvibacter antarcticus]
MHSTFVVHPKFESSKPQLEEVLAHFSEKGEYVTMGERNVIKKVIVNGTVFNLKKFKTPNIFQGFVYRFLRKTKAKRSYEYANRLIENHIKTPFPVGYSESFSEVLKQSFYISEHVDYDFDFRVLIHNPKYPNREEILRQFTQFSYKLHQNNVNFLDHSPGNTLVQDNGDGTYEFYLIDLNRMKFEPMSLDRRMHNLRRLWLSKAMIKIIASEYAKLSGSTYEEVHGLLSKHSRAFQKKVNSKKLRKKRK